MSRARVKKWHCRQKINFTLSCTENFCFFDCPHIATDVAPQHFRVAEHSWVGHMWILWIFIVISSLKQWTQTVLHLWSTLLLIIIYSATFTSDLKANRVTSESIKGYFTIPTDVVITQSFYFFAFPSRIIKLIFKLVILQSIYKPLTSSLAGLLSLSPPIL